MKTLTDRILSLLAAGPLGSLDMVDALAISADEAEAFRCELYALTQEGRLAMRATANADAWRHFEYVLVSDRVAA